MEQELNYWLLLTVSRSNSGSKYFYFLNADGTPRWIWPASNKKPVFLKFYNATSFKSRLFVWLVQLTYKLSIHSLIFKSTVIKASALREEFQIKENEDWAIFTGTIGVNRKAILYGKTKSGLSTFTKIALNNTSKKNLENEKQVLLALTKPYSYVTPNVFHHSQNWLQIEELETGKQSSLFAKSHLEFVNELFNQTGSTIILNDSAFKTSLDTQLKHTERIQDPRISASLIRKLRNLVINLEAEKESKFSFAHGDFTPWNCIISNNQLQVFDWELAQAMPYGYDALHFIIQNGILVDRLNWTKIYERLTYELIGTVFVDDNELKHYLKLYLAQTCSYYLPVYAKQKEWHTQIQWLITTWSDAISSLLSNKMADRELLIQDVFTFLNNTTYATLKLGVEIPEQLSQNSDIDFCLQKKDATTLRDYIKAHSLVSKTIITKKSHMINVTIWLKSGEFLSIDLIWKIKYKNLVFQDLNQLLHRAKRNSYGVRKISSKDEGEFVYHFYLLNSAEIPESYGGESFLRRISDSRIPTLIRKKLIRKLKREKDNRGFNYIKNSFDYCADIVCSLIRPNGLIVTFSGVDGAGKSTVIEHVHKLLTKHLRKEVVLLRHRPSILPILSAWTKGKLEAEQIAADSLPRKGTNKSLASSLFRFLYYYTDYLLGQYYIYFKFVLRGKVVLYDRYYFDFIADPRRSNLNLPNWITKIGYKLLLKPHLNFFLYADADTILKRKQELQEEEIKALTNSYLSLFNDLEATSTKGKYVPILNLDLSKTKATILRHFKQLAA